ncbi:hypothetical protein H4R33_005409 [Dimargaris cristalligena]|nr:hypothetical protein H4R33_005409 [Dimargaris cristalligena]
MSSEFLFNAKITRGLSDRLYEKRKASAFEIEKLIREQLAQKNQVGVKKILSCLVKEFAYSPQPYTRGGGLIALATSAIALGTNEIRYFLDDIVPPVLACFSDHDTQVKYYACEAMYNIAKVAKGEILRFFNEIFDALSKTAADTDKTVKKGTDLLDKLIMDIVSEEASTYVSIVSDMVMPTTKGSQPSRSDTVERIVQQQQSVLAFSLERFIPLLTDRVSTINPNTRVFLIKWLRVLDSLPDLELIHYLPRFLREVFLYLSDPNEEVRTITALLLTDFLVELNQIALIRPQPDKRNALLLTATNGSGYTGKGSGALDTFAVSPRSLSTVGSPALSEARPSGITSPRRPGRQQTSVVDQAIPRLCLDPNQRGGVAATAEDQASLAEDLAGAISDPLVPGPGETDARIAWVPRQTVEVDFASLIHIINDLLNSSDHDVQHAALHWIAKFITMVPSAVVPFTPNLIERILPSLSHENEAIKKAAVYANAKLYHLIQDIPLVTPPTPSPTPLSTPAAPPAAEPRSRKSPPDNGDPRSPVSDIHERPISGVSSPRRSASALSQNSNRSASQLSPKNPSSPALPDQLPLPHPTGKASAATSPLASVAVVPDGESVGDRSPTAKSDGPAALSTEATAGEQSSPTAKSDTSMLATVPQDPFNLASTVTTLIVTYSNGQEETRISCVDWLLMLHRKAPLRMAKEETLVSNDGSFPVFLKIMSDPSEEVVKKNLQLLAQFSAYLDTEYFQRFMVKLLELFSTDRQLLETRGSLIIRRLCVSLNAELIYRTIAEILETNEDHEFASMMVQNLNTILVTSPELAELRHRLKYLDTKDSQLLFATLYRSWCHSPVATFTLCLLAQAYEHAANLLPIFAEMEMTVALLVQVDKLVQLIESPVFTYLRLQLLEPDRYPYLYKCLYGILMLLPQSSAFNTLRSRLHSVSALSYLHTARFHTELGGGIGGGGSPLGSAVNLSASSGISGMGMGGGGAAVGTGAGGLSGGLGGSGSGSVSGIPTGSGIGVGPGKRSKMLSSSHPPTLAQASSAGHASSSPVPDRNNDPIKFNELLIYFRNMQLKHAKFFQSQDYPLGRDPSATSSYRMSDGPGSTNRPPHGPISGGISRPHYLSSLTVTGPDDYHNQPLHRRSSGSPGLYGTRGRSPSILGSGSSSGGGNYNINNNNTNSNANLSGQTTATSSTRTTRGPLGPAVKAIRRTIGKR